ncbi:class I SAM-dependent methyltransferase [Chitinophaga sedimenti]|nr:methyltransferase domain-containing protein [Chitinophaga sedimenti]MCK7553827.1 class I SAM-dependent methyltransferase [Chitinophaga sedimenti]
MLKPGGALLIAVPNYTSKDAQHYGEHWAAYDVPRHLYHFSPTAMQNMLQAHGVTVVKTSDGV